MPLVTTYLVAVSRVEYALDGLTLILIVNACGPVAYFALYRTYHYGVVQASNGGKAILLLSWLRNLMRSDIVHPAWRMLW